jgi:ABC-type antimicrobial peptide transport system permease subunit
MLVGAAQPTIDDFAAGYVVIRTRGDVSIKSLIDPIRGAMRNVRSDIRSIEVQPLAQTLDRDYRPLKLGAATFGSFAALATLLSAVGLYGILAFSVAQRTGEFGIRAALGARATHLVRNVVGQGMAVVVVGLLAGMVLSWYASATIAALLFNSSARDAAPYTYAAILLGVVALTASAIPAWRATRIDPANALRAE